MTTTVVGVFNSEAAAQNAVNELRTAGVPMDNISVIARPSGDIVNERGEVISVADDDHMTAGEGLTVGAVWGGLVGLAALAIPGIGPLVTSNVFAAALTGAVAGAATGGIAGALIDAASVPEEHARVYEDRVRSGGTLVTAQVDDSMAMQARSILQTSGAEDFNWDDPNSYSRTTVGDDEAAYAESSKVGTVGGGVAGAVTGAAIGAAGGPVGAVVGGTIGAVTGGTIGAVGDTIGEKTEDEVYGDAIRTANTADRNYDAVTQPEYLSAKMEADKNRLDEAGYVGGGLRTDSAINSAERDYADSSKVGTVGGGVAGAVVGSGIGAAGDTVGERIEDTAQGDTTPMDRGYTSDRTMSSTDYRDDRTFNAGNPVANAANRTGDAIRDAATDDQGTDTFQAAMSSS